MAQHTHTLSLAEFDTIVPPVFSFLQLTGCVDCRLDFIANFAALGAGCLDGFDDLFGFLVGDFTEDDVFAIKPVGYDGGDEELRAVSIIIDFPHQHKHFSPRINTDDGNELKGDEGRRGSWKEDGEGGKEMGRGLRVWSSIGHGEKEWLLVLLREVLVCEFLAIDRLATGALLIPKRGKSQCFVGWGESRKVPFTSLRGGRCAVDHKNAGERERERSLTLPRVKSPP